VDVDTSFFTGNYPQSVSIEACGCEGYPSPAELAGMPWETIVPVTPLAGDSHNVFAVSGQQRFTHVRLSAYPDGGIARLRVNGRPLPDPRGLEHLTIDLAGQEFGGLVVASSDDFYTAASTLNRPDSARTMGEGWETQRRRDGGNDYAVFRLAFAGRVRRVIIDTAHFKYNASAAVTLSCSATDVLPGDDPGDWLPLLDRVRLQPDTRHVFDLDDADPVTFVRLDAFPDGGISRVRLIGVVDAAARRAAGYEWFNALPDGQAAQCLTAAGLGREQAADVVRKRPLTEQWLGAQSQAGPGTAILTEMLEGRVSPPRS
jgi:allantoicase